MSQTVFEQCAVSQTVADLPAFLRGADHQLKDAVLAVLLSERMGRNPTEPLAVPGIGFVLPFAPFGGQPPDLTPEREAELAERLKNLDHTFTLEELFASEEVPPAGAAANR